MGNRIKILIVLFFLSLTSIGQHHNNLLMVGEQFLPSADYWVASWASGSGVGSKADPWTLIQASAASLSAGDTVGTFPGDELYGYWLPNNSGSSGNPIVFGTVGYGTRTKIYQSQVLTGFSQRGGSNIYTKYITTEILQLFENGTRKRLAREPESGYHYITTVNSTTEFESDDIDIGIDHTGATGVFRTNRFIMEHKGITDNGDDTYELSSVFRDGSLTVDRGFFLCDKLEYLDAAGEWYYNPVNDTLYVRTSGSDSSSNYTIRGSVYDYGVDLTNKNYINVEGIELLHSGDYGVYLSNADYCKVDNNRIISPDLIGVYVPAAVALISTITNNYIYQANGNGVRTTQHSTVINDNEIEDVGLLENINKRAFPAKNDFGTGIKSTGDYVSIQNNTGLNVGYNGINWRGVDSEINENFIDGACLVLDDGGGTVTGLDWLLPSNFSYVPDNTKSFATLVSFMNSSCTSVVYCVS